MADVTMENSRDKRVNTLLLQLVWIREYGNRKLMLAPACLSLSA